MLDTITPATHNAEPMDPVSVIVATLSGKLAVHRTIDGKGYTVTHVPSGFAAHTRIRRKKDAIDLMLRLDALGDWNFRNPFARKWQGQMSALAGIVAGVERY